MKIYKTNWHGYSAHQNQQVPPEVIIQNFQNWQAALYDLLKSQDILMDTWDEINPYCEILEIEDSCYDQWILKLLYQEQKKPLPQKLGSLQDDSLFQKIAKGFIKSKYSNLWIPQAYLPIDESCIFDYVDPDEEAMCFGSLSNLTQAFSLLRETSDTYHQFITFCNDLKPGFILVETNSFEEITDIG